MSSAAKISGLLVNTLTRCRNVSKPPGAKPGLVFLNGDVKTVKVDLKREAKLLDALDETVKLN